MPTAGKTSAHYNGTTGSGGGIPTRRGRGVEQGANRRLPLRRGCGNSTRRGREVEEWVKSDRKESEWVVVQAQATAAAEDELAVAQQCARTRARWTGDARGAPCASASRHSMRKTVPTAERRGRGRCSMYSTYTRAQRRHIEVHKEWASANHRGLEAWLTGPGSRSQQARRNARTVESRNRGLVASWLVPALREEHDVFARAEARRENIVIRSVLAGDEKTCSVVTHDQDVKRVLRLQRNRGRRWDRRWLNAVKVVGRERGRPKAGAGGLLCRAESKTCRKVQRVSRKRCLRTRLSACGGKRPTGGCADPLLSEGADQRSRLRHTDLCLAFHPGRLAGSPCLGSQKAIYFGLVQIHARGVLHKHVAPWSVVRRPNGAMCFVDFFDAEVGHRCDPQTCKELCFLRNDLGLPDDITDVGQEY
ncbi:hypothetical protein GGX14DRAFT_388061 [Mycena pura]|uniref:Protein kinase domain-containing protein n=1 Tax=Mycena pura TaxID=153505 RepID=A0AAD6VTC6_9AGAR|nr:hypothetical protein GGX14DRAFT_388061 [Mycena pura]